MSESFKNFFMNPAAFIYFELEGVKLYYPINSNTSRKVFSFSIFLTGQNTADWRGKYMVGQLNAIEGISRSNEWLDYGFIHFFELNTLKSIFDLADAGDRENADIIKRVLMLMSTERYRLFVYSQPESLSPYWGTVVRFLPMLMPEVDVVLFRDAHSTIPNSLEVPVPTRDGPMLLNALDRAWVTKWEQEPDKPYMFYTMAGYQPDHAMGFRRPLAGAWGAKKINGLRLILGEDIFTTYLFNPKFAASAKGNNSVYGVDEQLLYNFITSPGIVGQSQFIGIVWLLYLFFPQTNLERFTKKKIKTARAGEEAPVEEMEKCIGAGNIMMSNNFYNSARCIMYSAINAYGATAQQENRPQEPWDGKISNLTVLEVMMCMGYARAYAQSMVNAGSPKTTEEWMYREIIQFIPDAKNLWDGLFNSYTLNSTILAYINGFYIIEANELNDLCDKEKRSISEMKQFGGSGSIPISNLFKVPKSKTTPKSAKSKSSRS
jgi:hypothetical protein